MSDPIMIPNDRNEDVVSLFNYAFARPYSGNKLVDFREMLTIVQNIGEYDNDQLMGQLSIIPFHLNLYGEIIPASGVGFVAVYPEYRQRGVMKRVIPTALEQMHQNGQLVSFLEPFSQGYYRHFGWELAFDTLHYELRAPYNEIKGNVNSEITGERELYHVKRQKFSELMIESDASQLDPKPQNGVTFEQLISYFNQEVAKDHGRLKREKFWWERLMRRQPNDFIAFALDDNDDIKGFCVYGREETTFTITEYHASSVVADETLWRFLHSHRSNVFTIKGTVKPSQKVGHYLNDPQVTYQLTTPFMGRIVSVADFLTVFLKIHPVKEEIVLPIEDRFAPWNTGVYRLGNNYVVKHDELTQGTATNSTITPTASVQLPKLSINELSGLLLGHQSIDQWLFEHSDFLSLNQQAILRKWLAEIQPLYFTEHF